MKFSTERILDKRIDVEIDGSGMFSAEFEDQDYSAPTRKELVEKLQAAVRKAKKQGTVNVTVLGLVPAAKRYASDDNYAPGAGVVHAKLRARHERQNAWLLISESKQRFQVGTYRTDSTIVRRLTDAEVAGYLDLREAVRMAEVALEDFIGAVKIDPDQALQDAAEAEKTGAK
jgi:hypothetical protein